MAWIRKPQPLFSDDDWRAASLTLEVPFSPTGKTNTQPAGVQTPQHMASLHLVSCAVMLGMGLGLECGQHRILGGISPLGAQLGVGVRWGGADIGGWAWPVTTTVSACSSSLCWSRAALNSGPNSFLLTPASRMGSGHSEDPSQTWEKYFANKGHQTNPPILAFLFSSPLRSHNEKCYLSQM